MFLIVTFAASVLALVTLDLYPKWARVRDIDEGGALLVRPDGHIRWRGQSAAPNVERAFWAPTFGIAPSVASTLTDLNGLARTRTRIAVGLMLFPSIGRGRIQVAITTPYARER